MKKKFTNNTIETSVNKLKWLLRITSVLAFFALSTGVHAQCPNATATPPSQTICSGVPISIALTSDQPFTTYSWTFVQTDVVGATNGAGSTISDTLTAVEVFAGSAVYTVTPFTAGCPGGGPSINVTITVNPKPTATATPASQAICTGSATSIALTSDVASTSFSWTTVNSGTSGATAGSGINIIQTLSTTGASTGVSTYNITPVAAGCSGNIVSVPVTVRRIPTVAATPNAQTVCSGVAIGTITLSNPNAVTGTTYSWTRNNNVTLTGMAASGGGSTINGTLTNSTTSAVTSAFSIIATANICSSAPITANVTVDAAPTMTSSNAATICSGNTVSIPLTSDISATYSWIATNNTNTTGESTTLQSGSPLSNAITNNTSVVQNVTYSVTPTSTINSCVGTAQPVIVTVDAKPSITAQTAGVCSGTAFSVTPVDVTDGIVPVGTTYTWSAPVVTGGVTGGALEASPQATISQTLTNPTNTAQTATYTVTPTAATCVGSTFTITVTVNPRPSITSITALTCSETAFSVTPVNVTNGIVPAGTTYTWAAPVVTGGVTGGNAQAVGQAAISETLTNPTSTPQTATYTVTPTAGGCVGSTFTITVTINPKPSVIPQTATICSASAFTVTPADGGGNVVPAGTTYTWTNPIVTGGITGGSAQAVGQASISQTLTNPTSVLQTATYTVTPLQGSCTGATFTVTVTVDPKPAVINQTPTACSGYSFTVTPADGADGIVPAGTTYTWTSPVVTGGITGGSAQGAGQASISQTLTNPTNTIQTATYTVTPTSGSCVGSTFTVTVTVTPDPFVGAQTAITCSGIAFTVTPVDGGGNTVPAGTTYTWSAPVVTGGLTGGSAQAVGQPSISQTLTNPANTSQTATYTVTPAAGSCVGATFTVTVTVNPTPAITVQTSTICSGSAFTVTPANGADGIVPAGTTYTWSSPVVTGGLTGGSAQGSAQSSISQTLTNPTNTAQTAIYTVTPLSGSCTGATFTITVTVDPRPAITAQTPITCSGTVFTVTPVNITDGIVPAGTTYTWLSPVVTGGVTGGSGQFSQASVSQTLTNPTNSAQTATYTVVPTAGTCIGSPFTVTVTVNPLPSITNQTAVSCSGTAFTASPANGTNGIVPAGTTYTWSAPLVTGGVTGGSAQAIPQSSISETLVNPTNIAQTATYTVTPTSGSCTGPTFTVTVTVDPTPSVTDQIPVICSGTAFTITPVNITDGILPAGTTYTWLAPIVSGGVSGGSAQAVPQSSISETLTNPTSADQLATYTVTPVAGSCTGSTFTITVTVNPVPSALAQTPSACSETAFNGTPADGGGNIIPSGTTYTWPAPVVTGGITGGGAQTAQPSISETLTNPTSAGQTATYTVTPTSGSCTGNAFTVTVTVNPKPAVNALTDITCSESAFMVTPLDGIDGIVPAGTGYTWTAPVVTGGITGGTAQLVPQASISETLTNPSNIPQTATYTVTPISGSSCTGLTFTLTVTVNPKPTVITTDPATVCAPATIDLTLPGVTAGSTAGLTFTYFTNAAATTHTVDSSAVTTSGAYYIVGLTGLGCSDTTAVTVTVNLPAVGGVVEGDTTVCPGSNGDTLILTDYVGTIQKWQYSIDQGTSWIDIVNTTAQQSYLNLTTTTWYRALMATTCTGAISEEARITVDTSASSAGGVVSSPIDTVCRGSNNDTLTLTGQTGAVLRWEYSIDGGTTWIASNNTTNMYIYTNLTTTTIFHAVVQNTICGSAVSSDFTLTVIGSEGGSIIGAQPGCAFANGGTLMLSGYSGAVTVWQYSTDSGATWLDSANTTDTYVYSNLSDTTMYRVIVQNASCAADTSAAQTLLVYPKPLAAFTADTACLGSVTTFVNTSSVVSGTIQFNQWNFGDNAASFLVNPTHTYSTAGLKTVSLTTVSDFGCLDTAIVNVLIHSLPSAQIVAASSLSFCCGGSVTLSGNVGLTYLWTASSETTQSITVSNCLASGSYQLMVTDPATSCSNVSSVSVVIFPSPVANAGNDVSIILGNSVELNGQGGVIYSWLPSSSLSDTSVADPVANPIVTTAYQLTVSDINGCVDVDSVTVTVVTDINEVVVTNLLTTNGDGYNDKWIVTNVESFPGTEVIVINREGQQVFYSSSYDNSWTGLNKNGKSLPDGTYYYFIKFPNTDKVNKGPLTILNEKK
ncbi:MAG: PKD-like domain-containing protein [Bacteroidota bacterium]